MSHGPCVFAMNATRPLGERVADCLDVTLAPHEERDFEDGEYKVRPLVSVRERDVYVIHSLYGDPEQSASDKLVRLLFFIGALVDASAARVTAVVPYLCYARKEQKTQPRDPVLTRYVARLFEAVGTHRVVALDVHNLAAFQNAFRCATEHLEAKQLFVEHFARMLGDEEVVVVSPDAGGAKRAERLRDGLNRILGRPVSGAFMEKYRRGGVVSGEALVGEVGERVAIIVDDLVSTGTTLARAARACRAGGAKRVFAAASHGLFVGKAGTILAEAPLEQVVVTNSVSPFRLAGSPMMPRLVVLGVEQLIAQAITRMHEGGSLTDLLEG